MKSKVLAYAAWLFGVFGILGFQRFYLGKHGTAFLWMFTAGLFGIGAVFDLVSLHWQVEAYNAAALATDHSS